MYQRAGLPVQIIAETPDWRRVRDPDGEEVWMHRRLLSGRRAVRALNEADMLARPEDEAALVARIEPGAVLWLERCRAGWCRLEAGGQRGWAEAAAFWGVYADEAEPSGALEGLNARATERIMSWRTGKAHRGETLRADRPLPSP